MDATRADTELRRAIVQQLRTDRLLGLRELPIVPAAPPPSRSRDVSAPRTTGAHAATGTSSEPVASTAPPRVASGDSAVRLKTLDDAHVKGCRKCGLCESRTQTVFGQGNPTARLVFVGEAPGFEEDRQGLAFVGRAGALLTKMIAAMGLTRDDVFICNVLKCRPPNNRTPANDEIAACSPYLHEQLEIIDPEVIVALGTPAAQTLLETSESMGRMRGRFHQYHVGDKIIASKTIPVMPTYHPAYLLRSPQEKGKVWEDLKQVMAFLGLPLPAR